MKTMPRGDFVSDTNLEYAVITLALSMIRGMGNARLNQTLALVQRCRWDLSQLRDVSAPAFIRQVQEQDPTIASLLTRCDTAYFETAGALIQRAQENGIRPVTIRESGYPASIRTCLGNLAPPLLFVLGNAALLHDTAGAVAGTRAPSARGEKAARTAAEAIVEHTMSLVSGGATGVDHAAHDAAIAAGKNTVLILPQGLLTWTPPASWRDALNEGRLAAISACMPDAPWQTHAAVARNALISAQAQTVCIVEPKKQGGSLLTMRHAIHQRKPTFVTPLHAAPPGLRPYVHPIGDLDKTLASLDLKQLLHTGNMQDGQAELP